MLEHLSTANIASISTGRYLDGMGNSSDLVFIYSNQETFTILMQNFMLRPSATVPRLSLLGISCHHFYFGLVLKFQVSKSQIPFGYGLLKILKSSVMMPPGHHGESSIQLPNAAHTKDRCFEHDIIWGYHKMVVRPQESWDNTSLYRKSSSLVAVAVSNEHCLSYFFLVVAMVSTGFR